MSTRLARMAAIGYRLQACQPFQVAARLQRCGGTLRGARLLTACTQLGRAYGNVTLALSGTAQPLPAGAFSSAAAAALPQQQGYGGVLARRKYVLQHVPFELLRVVGVSFDGRQDAIAQLRRDQALAVVHEPENPHDQHAMAVKTLSGTPLGYIPRDQTARFMHPLCFGFVYSVGQTPEGLWGFKLAVQPLVLPVEVLALPSSLAQEAFSLTSALQGPEWNALQAVTMAGVRGWCEVTGGGPARCQPRWQVDDASRTLRLAGFRVLAGEVQQVERLLQLEGSEQQEEAQQLLRQLNAWSESDVEQYVAWVRALHAARDEGPTPWRLDLSLLQQHGISVPSLPHAAAPTEG